MTPKPKPTVARPHRLDRALHRIVHPRLGDDLRDDRGASLVEYSLIFALVIVVAIGAGRYLTTQGTSQVANQANCVAVRPPATLSSGCVLPAVTASTTTTVSPTTAPSSTSSSTSSSSTSSSTSSTTTPVVVTSSNLSGGTYDKANRTITGVTFTMTKTPGPNTWTGAFVVFQIKQANSPTIYTDPIPCTSAGVCTLTLTNLQYSVGSVTVQVYSINSTPAAPIPGNMLTFT